MRPAQLLAAVFAVSSVSAAWPDLDSSNALAPLKNVIYGRQDNTESPEPSATEPPKSSAKDDEEKPQSTGDADETDKPTGSTTPSPTGKESGAKETGKTTKTKSKSIGADKPAGGIQMLTPAPIAGQQYYKIGDWVTFAWNYTSLIVTPSAVDVLATCTKNQATYTIAVNQTVHETNKVLWNTEKDKNGDNPLLTDMYTLLIYDAESSVSAVAQPGHLAANSQHRFGMYLPQKYVDWDKFECANCNGAMGTLTLNALFITCGTTLGSLLYFAYSFGLY